MIGVVQEVDADLPKSYDQGGAIFGCREGSCFGCRLPAFAHEQRHGKTE